MKKRILQFSVLALLLVVACAMPLKVADAATGSISASSQYIYVSSPTSWSPVTISWSTSGCSNARVYVCMDNYQDKHFTGGTSGSQVANWITAGSSFTFKLYAGTDERAELLDTVTVVGYTANSGTIGAKETEVIIPTGSSLGTAELTWAVNGYATAQVYVKMDNNADQLWGQNPNGCSTATWIQDGHKYQFKLYANTSKTTLLDSVTVYGRKYAYEVGPNYLSTGPDFLTTHFIPIYHTGSVRSTVLSQLQSMANAGATRLKLGIFPYGKGMGSSPWPNALSGTDYWCHFPPEAQELANIRQYAQDVAAIQASDGHRLCLDVEFYWHVASDYTTGSTSGNLGYFNIAASQFKAWITVTYQQVILNVYNVYRPDGKKVVSSISFDNETSMGKTNMDWMLTDTFLYPGFVSYALNHGLTPALELICIGRDMSSSDIMSTTITDPNYSILNGHRPMYWPYRTLKFMKDNGVYIPSRIDLSMYPQKGGYTYNAMITKIFDDADAVLPSLGIRKYYGVTEAEYFHPTYTSGNALREELGDAFAQERLRNNRLCLLQFWTTPAPIANWYPAPGEDPYVYPNPSFPYQIDDYLP